jgi:hypothetical protein
MSSTRVYLALAWALLPAAASAQPPPPPTPPTVMVIRPAPAPVPALKYRIVPEGRTLVPGNAAVFYHRAIQMFLTRRQSALAYAQAQKESPPPGDDATFSWVNGPLRDIPRDKARAQIQAYTYVLNEVELGAMRKVCDWEFDLRKEGFSLLIPEIQEMRALGRLVALRARLAVLEGKTDEAVHWLQVGLVMSRHVSQGPTLIQALVGCNINGMMARAFEDLIQAPGTPSLYWALANRPRPFIDLTAPFEGERVMFESELPMLRELDYGPWTLEKACRFGTELQRKLGSWDDSDLGSSLGRGSLDSSPPRIEDLTGRLVMVGMVAKVYPDAKRALIARGRSAAEVEAMPALQVVLIDTVWGFDRFQDDVYKWTGLPYRQSSQAIDLELKRTYVDLKQTKPLLALFTAVLPALNSARLAAVRVDRQLDALQCIEAIRLYAAAHDGTLPTSLEAIAEAPTPLDPATGKPFDYKIDGATAILSAPLPPGAPNHPSYMLRYELKLSH